MPVGAMLPTWPETVATSVTDVPGCTTVTVEPLCLIAVTVLVGALLTVSGSAVQPLLTGPVLLLSPL